ncbi:glycosyl hydrolase family 18 protein [Facilibium subflavum]|uniref:glycosyl hydrolase family 18 protein n=1 Tax=Facilibium subflavum TaxID=2219058 RepID=UPI000E64E902|nr:hypothetical protein [Facilibium subflavum]
MKKKLLATTVLCSIVSLGFAGSASQPIDMNGWYQGVTMKDVTADSLGVKKGDQVSITTPGNSNVTSSWGSMSFGDCSTEYGNTQSTTTCTVTDEHNYTTDLSFGINAHGGSAVKQSSEVVVSSASQPKSQATIEISLPQKPDNISQDIKAHVVIYQGDHKVDDISDQPWGVTYNRVVNFSGDSAAFSIHVDNIDKDTAKADPATFNLSNGGTQAVKVSYQIPKPSEKGSLEVNLQTKSATTLPKNPSYRILDDQGVSVKSGELQRGINTFEGLDASTLGKHYTLKSDSFVVDNTKYSPEQAAYDFTIKPNQTSKFNIIYDSQSIPMQSLHFNVQGLPENASSTITLTGKGQSQSINVSENKTYDLSIPQNGETWTITASRYNQYMATVTPNSIVADGSTTPTVNVNYVKSTSRWPDRAIVGYVKGYKDQWKTQPDTTTDMIKSAISHGYNVFVYAFGGQSQDNTPYLKFSDAVTNQLSAQLQAIHQADKLAILSVGGAVNTFDADLSGGQAITAGEKMGNFLADKGFDGIDFDVEHPNASATGENLLNYIDAMRTAFKAKTGSDLVLTAAPQISGWYGTGQWASGSAKFAEAMYTQDFVNKAKFDAFLVQTYNQYGGANFGGLKGYDVGFLTMSFKLLSQETRDQMSGIPANAFVVPKGTKIVLGVPDFKDSSVTNEQYIQGTCLATAMCSGVGLYNPADINKDIATGNLQQYTQYGGLMTWILNSDAYQNWHWVDGVKNSA